eukprot:s399_g39.t1
MLVMLTQLSLINDANYCYANSTLVGLWWALLSRSSYGIGDWGNSAEALQYFFSHMDGSPMHLPSYFVGLFTMWANGARPADAAEFAFFILRWMDSPCFSHKWVRSYAIENTRHQHDLGDVHAPLFLQVPHATITSIDLTDLLNRWTKEYAMETALLESPEILLCHIDRTANRSDGTIEKLNFWLHADMVCALPVLGPDGCQVMHDYVPISLVAHLGDVDSGHYRAAIRLTVADDGTALSTQNTLWGLTNDGVTPQIHPLPGLPEWLCRNITLVMMVKLSCADIYRPLRDPGAGWLRLRELRQQVRLNQQAAQTASAEPLPSHPSSVPSSLKLPNDLPEPTMPDSDARASATVMQEDQMQRLMRMMRSTDDSRKHNP